MDYKDKYASREVLNLYIYDKDNNLISTINTLRSNEIVVTKKSRVLLKVEDALIDKKLLDYILDNLNFEAIIKGDTYYKKAENHEDIKIEIDIPKSKLLTYKIKTVCGEFTVVNMIFEAFTVNTNTETTRVLDLKFPQN